MARAPVECWGAGSGLFLLPLHNPLSAHSKSEAPVRRHGGLPGGGTRQCDSRELPGQQGHQGLRAQGSQQGAGQTGWTGWGGGTAFGWGTCDLLLTRCLGAGNLGGHSRGVSLGEVWAALALLRWQRLWLQTGPGTHPHAATPNRNPKAFSVLVPVPSCSLEVALTLPSAPPSPLLQ